MVLKEEGLEQLLQSGYEETFEFACKMVKVSFLNLFRKSNEKFPKPLYKNTMNQEDYGTLLKELRNE